MRASVSPHCLFPPNSMLSINLPKSFNNHEKANKSSDGHEFAYSPVMAREEGR